MRTNFFRGFILRPGDAPRTTLTENKFYHMMRARSKVSRSQPPGLLLSIRFERQHVYLQCQNAILFLVKPKYKRIGHHPSRHKCKAEAIAGEIPSEFDLKIVRRDGNRPISVQDSGDVTEDVGNSDWHPRQFEGVFR